MDGCDYLIIPRQETSRAITANGSKVTIEDIDYSPAQCWTLTDEGNGAYSFRNGKGLRLTAHRHTGNSSLTAQATRASEQNFRIELIDIANYKILDNEYSQYAFDLSGASSNAGTTVGTWQYSEGSSTPIHRQWMLFPVTAPKTEVDGIQRVEQDDRFAQTAEDGIYDLSGRRVADGNEFSGLAKGIYILNGKKVVVP